MAGTERINNTSRNLTVGILSKFCLLIPSIIARTLFIRILGAEYIGVSSLYTNILSFLNLADLGFGSVLTYELYRPLRDHDEQAIVALTAFFKRVYTVVILVVFGVGLALIPFLDYIIDSPLDVASLRIYYVLYLINSVASYFVVYRTMVIIADQKRYISTTVEIVCKIVMYICQSIYLVVTRDFLGYLCIQVLFTILNNVVLNQVAIRQYPYLRTLTRDGPRISEEQVTRIWLNVRAMFVSRISNTVLASTDSILISVMFSTLLVGYYSNYNELIIYINSIIYIITTSVEASVGNLNAGHDNTASYDVFRKMNLIMRFINTFCVTEFICIIQDFIVIWIGAQFVQGWDLVLAIMVTFYLQNAMNDISTFRQTMGLFDVVRKAYPFMAVINVILSIVLGEVIGVAGVILATGLSRLLTVFWYEGMVVYRKLDHTMCEYVRMQIVAAVMTIVISAIAYVMCCAIPYHNLLGIGIKAVLSAAIVMVAYWLMYRQSEDWKWCVSLVRDKLHLNSWHREHRG